MNTYTKGQRVRVKDDVWDLAGREGVYVDDYPMAGAHAVKLEGEQLDWAFYDNEIEAIEEQEA